MMKRIYLSMAALLLTALFCGAQEGPKSVVFLQSEALEIVDAMPIYDNSVIMFRGDSIVLRHGSWEGVIAKEHVRDFVHADNLDSEWRVCITNSGDMEVELDGLEVLLFNENSDVLSGIRQKTGADGVAVFENLPTARYSLYIYDGTGTCLAEFHGMHHGYNDECNVQLTQNASVVDVYDEGDATYIHINGYASPIPSPGIYIRKTPTGTRKVIVK